MKKNLLLSFVFLSTILFNSCEFLGDVFKTGVWVGVIIVIAVIAVIMFIVKMFSK